MLLKVGCDAARALAASCDVDLVITDVSLPDGDGVALMREIHEECGVLGIAVTGHPFDVDLPMREAGFREAVIKPVDFRNLEAAILRVRRSRHGD